MISVHSEFPDGHSEVFELGYKSRWCFFPPKVGHIIGFAPLTGSKKSRFRCSHGSDFISTE